MMSIRRIVRAVVLVVLTIVVRITSIVPYLGANIGNVEVRFQDRIENRLGGIKKLRDRHVMPIHRFLPMDHIDISKETAREEIHQTRQDAERDHRIGEIIIALVGGLISVSLAITGYIIGLSIFLGLLLALLPVIVLLRIAIVDILLFDNEATNENIRSKLVLMLFWNRVILKHRRVVSRAMLGAMIMRDDERSIDLVNEMITFMLQGEGDIFDAANEYIWINEDETGN